MNRAEIAHLLRQARARTTPADVGLAVGLHRRVPGLRREEVALLAGVSVDYVVRLEQGRGPHPSAAVLSGLARALRLDDDETRELFGLAGLSEPRAGEIPLLVRASVHRLLDRLVDLPAMVLSAKGDVLAWNPLGAALLGNWAGLPLSQRNLNWQRFLGHSSRVVMTEQEEKVTAANAVAGLRATLARYPHDTGLRALLTELGERSPRFVELWSQTTPAPWRSHRKTIRHPEVGQLTLDCDALHLPDTDQVLVVYSAAPGSEPASQLELLRVLGHQQVGADALER